MISACCRKDNYCISWIECIRQQPMAWLRSSGAFRIPISKSSYYNFQTVWFIFVYFQTIAWWSQCQLPPSSDRRFLSAFHSWQYDLLFFKKRNFYRAGMFLKAMNELCFYYLRHCCAQKCHPGSVSHEQNSSKGIDDTSALQRKNEVSTNVKHKTYCIFAWILVNQDHNSKAISTNI